MKSSLLPEIQAIQGGQFFLLFHGHPELKKIQFNYNLWATVWTHYVFTKWMND